MIRSAAEISTIMPSVESSTRIEYSKMRRDGSDRNSVDRISVTAEPMIARIFRKRAKSSTMKLPPKVDELAGRQHQFQHAGDDQQHHRKPGDESGRPLAAIGAQHQQRHGADGQHQLRQHRQQLITCTLRSSWRVVLTAAIIARSAAAFTAVTAVL